MVNFMGIAAGIGESVAASIKEEQKRIDLLTDKALDYHTKEYYRLKERRREKVDNTEAIIGELAAKFGDDENALRRAAFYVNQHGIQGTKALMNDFDKERATNNTISAVDFFKYVPTDKDVPLRTKREYAQGIVAPVQLGEPEFLTGVKSDRGIASLFTGDPQEALQRGFQERKAMGLYGKETERPDLQFGTGGVDRSLLLGAPKTDAQRLASSKQRLDVFRARNTPEDIAKSAALQKQQADLENNISSLEKNAIINNIKSKVPQSASGLMATGNQLMAMSDPNSDDYRRGAMMVQQGEAQKRREEEIESSNTGGRLSQGYVTAEWNREVKILDAIHGRNIIGGDEQFIFTDKARYEAAKRKLYEDTNERYKGRLDKKADAAWADIGLKNNITTKSKEEKEVVEQPKIKKEDTDETKTKKDLVLEKLTLKKDFLPSMIRTYGEAKTKGYLKKNGFTDKEINSILKKTKDKKVIEKEEKKSEEKQESVSRSGRAAVFDPVIDFFKSDAKPVPSRRRNRGGLMGRN